MYAAKYQKYITRSTSRFAEPSEIKKVSSVAFDHQKASGAPLYYKNGKLFVDNEDDHTLVVGPSGCKKTRLIVNSAVASIIEAGESAIINDPKGEVYRKTAKRARELGAKVTLLNFRKPSTSLGWNPLSQSMVFNSRKKFDEALQSICDFAESVIGPSMQRTVDSYWGDSSKGLLTSILLLLLESVPKEYFNLKTMIPFCYESGADVLKQIMDRIDQLSTAAYGLRSVLDLAAENTKSCVYSSLLAAIKPLAQNKALLDMLCRDDLSIEAIGKEQHIVYLTYPDEKNNLNFLINLFFTQAYETLVSVASEQPDDKLPVRVNFIYDEFSNLTCVDNFSNRISEARSKNIRYFLIIQSFNQLKQKYSNDAETIISNCNNWICFGSKEIDFLEKLSKISGKELDFYGIEHDLISAAEMQHLEKRRESCEVLIIKQGQYPFVTDLPDFDYLPISKKYIEDKKETNININQSNALTVTPENWWYKVQLDIFKFPFPKAS